MNMNDLYLSHHGIKGQKWGVRRYQNSDGSLTEAGKQRYSKTGIILQPNAKLFRIANKEEKELMSGSYAAIKTKNDYNKYAGVYAGLLIKEGKDVVEKQLSTVGSLKIPSHSTSVKLMTDTLNQLNFRSDTKKQNDLKKYLTSEISEENNKSDRLFSKGLKEFDEYLNNGVVKSNLYDTLNVSFSDKRDNIMRPIINTYTNTLKDSGYAAVLDMNDTKYGVYNTDFPMIIADVSKFKVSNIVQLTDNEVKQARSQLNENFLKSLRWE
jgi:hypothetical protein